MQGPLHHFQIVFASTHHCVTLQRQAFSEAAAAVLKSDVHVVVKDAHASGAFQDKHSLTLSSHRVRFRSWFK